MNEVIDEHLERGFIQSVQYQSRREGNCAEEVLVRYYPGKFAVKVTRRILDSLRTQEPLRKASGRIADKTTDDAGVQIERELTRLGIAPNKARKLVLNNRAVVERQLRALPHRERAGIRDTAAWLVRAVEENFELPEAMVRANRDESALRELRKKGELDRARQDHEDQFREFYAKYVDLQAEQIQRTHREDYQAFLMATEDEREQNDRFLDSPEIRKILFENLFIEFFHSHKDNPVLTFWEWDEGLNPEPFKQ